MRLSSVAFLTVLWTGCYVSHDLGGRDLGGRDLGGPHPEGGAVDLGRDAVILPLDLGPVDGGTDFGPDLPPIFDAGMDAGVLHPAVALVVGYQRGCAIRRDGTFACWGQGPLGDGTTGDSTSAVQVPGLTDIVAAAVGAPGLATLTTCVVRRSGGVACWGENGSGTIGDGTTTRRLTPVDVVGVDDAIDIAISYHTTCVVRAGGAVKCWGDGSFGQLGTDGLTSSLTPVDVPSIVDATAIAASHDAFCVLRVGGTVSCWGKDTIGDVPGAVHPPGYTAAPIDVPSIDSVVQLAGSSSDRIAVGFCALRSDGTSHCWAFDPFLMFGLMVPRDAAGYPELTALAPSTQIAIAPGIACGVGTDANVRCYGTPYMVGDFGAGASPVVDTMTAVQMHLPDGHAVRIAADFTFTCALLDTGGVLCSGAPSARGGFTTEPTAIVGL